MVVYYFSSNEGIAHFCGTRCRGGRGADGVWSVCDASPRCATTPSVFALLRRDFAASRGPPLHNVKGTDTALRRYDNRKINYVNVKIYCCCGTTSKTIV